LLELLSERGILPFWPSRKAKTSDLVYQKIFFEGVMADLIYVYSL